MRNSKLGPPMVARALAIAHTSIYDAWALYDDKAVGTRLGSSLRRPARERTAANTAQAINFAAYRSAVDLFPGSVSSVFDPLMRSLGYDAADGNRATAEDRGGRYARIAGHIVPGGNFNHSDGGDNVYIQIS